MTQEEQSPRYFWLWAPSLAVALIATAAMRLNFALKAG